MKAKEPQPRHTYFRQQVALDHTHCMAHVLFRHTFIAEREGLPHLIHELMTYTTFYCAIENQLMWEGKKALMQIAQMCHSLKVL